MRDITDESEVNDVLGAPEALLLKHGASCSISAGARQELESFTARYPDMQVLALEVTKHADLADRVAERLGVAHESPQLFLLRRGKVVWHAEHHHITARAIQSRLAD